jgi:hypothetical protein
MGGQVLGRRYQDERVVFEMAQARVAATAEQSTDSAGSVIVVNGQILDSPLEAKRAWPHSLLGRICSWSLAWRPVFAPDVGSNRPSAGLSSWPDSREWHRSQFDTFGVRLTEWTTTPAMAPLNEGLRDRSTNSGN